MTGATMSEFNADDSLYPYLVSTFDQQDRRTVRWIAAADAQHAVRSVREEGHARIVLHTDDPAAQVLKATELGKSILSPADTADLRTMSPFGTFRLFYLRLIRQLKWILGAALLAAVLLIPSRGVLNYGSAGLILMLAALAILLGYRLRFGLQKTFRDVSEDLSRGNWDAALNGLSRIQTDGMPAITAMQVELSRASALAALGRHEEADSLLNKLDESGECPDWIFMTMAADVVQAMGRQDEAEELLRDALEEKPNDPSVMTRLAGRLVLNHLDDPNSDLSEPAQLLQATGAQHLSDTLVHVHRATCGALSSEQGDQQSALQQLESAIAGLRPFAPNDVSIASGLKAVEGWYALVLHRLGRDAEGAALFEQNRPFLASTVAAPLLRALDRAYS